VQPDPEPSVSYSWTVRVARGRGIMASDPAVWLVISLNGVWSDLVDHVNATGYGRGKESRRAAEGLYTPR
jgi:hypothetical protein